MLDVEHSEYINMIFPAIVISAFSRPNALARLLWFLQNAKYEYNDIPLIISLDGNSHSDVIKIAQCFEWKFGTKRIIQHKEQLGLRNHILTCGDLTEEYEAIILLEDDLIVSPYFYAYAINALQYYKSDHNVAGISLYSYRNNEFAENAPFIPITNGYDAYFMQVPSSWGQLWTRQQWSNFRLCYPNIQLNIGCKLPDAVISWPETSWKKYFFKYMIDNNKYFVYPYTSYTSNWGDAGTHFAELNAFARVPICCSKKVLYQFPSITDTDIIYDAFMEISPNFFKRNGVLLDSNFIVDLYGIKDLKTYSQTMTITTKDCVNSCSDYGLDIMPFEMNVVLGLKGDAIHYVNKLNVSEFNYNHSLESMEKAYNIHAFMYGYQAGQLMKSKTTSYRLGHTILSPFFKIKSFLQKRKH